jgi:hypothetical protein
LCSYYKILLLLLEYVIKFISRIATCTSTLILVNLSIIHNLNLYPVEMFCNLDVRGSVHHSTIYEEKSNKMKNVLKFYYFLFIWSSTCFGRHTAHQQEPKTALAAPGFSYVKGCWTCSWWTLSGTVCLTTSTNCSFRLLMMDCVLPEICWALYK